MNILLINIISFFKKHGKCISWSILTLALLFICRDLITEILWDVNEMSWMTCIDQDSLGWLFVALCILGSYLIWKKCKNKNTLISEGYASISLIIALCYLYLRIDGTIDFNKVVWKLAYSDFIFLPIGTTIYLSHKRTIQKRIADDHISTFNDRPIYKEEDDELGFGKMIDVLLDDIKHTDLSKEAFSIGLVGKWGQGKSSFANLLKGRLDPQNTILIEFNPRNSKNIESIAEDFFNIFSEALHPYHTGIKSSIKKYANTLQIVLDDNIIGKCISLIQNLSASDSKEHINKAIKEIGRTIYVVVDDLDRLTAKEILETLKLIDRNADFVNTVFITAYDKDYVNEVLKHYLGYKSDIFTDKYFDYEISLPELNAASIYNIINKFISRSRDNDAKKTLSEFWTNYGYQYVKFFSSIRHIKRFINILLNRYKEVYADVNVKDFFSLTLIRYYDTNAYNDIAIQKVLNYGSLLMGGNPNVLYLNKESLDKELSNSWEFTKEVITNLFSAEDGTVANSYQRIYDVNYFDLYFYDYKEGKLYLKDLSNLFSAKNDNEAITLLEEFIRKDKIGLYRYLENIPISKLGSIDKLTRYVRLCLQYRKHCELRNYNLLYELFAPLRDDSYKHYQNALGIKYTSEYITQVLSIYKSFIPKYPLQLQQLFQVEYQNNTDLLTSILDKESIKSLELDCQTLFLEQFDEQKNDISEAFAISNIFANEGGKCDEEACRNLLRFMNQHKNLVSMNIFDVKTYQGMNRDTINLVIFIDQVYNKFTAWFPIDGHSFLDWVNGLDDDKLKFIITETYNKVDARLTVKALKPEYKKEEIDAIYEAIQTDYEIRDLNLIKKSINDENVYDLTTLCKSTGLKEDRIFELNEIHKNDFHLPYCYLRTMQPFEEGDIVKLKTDVQELLVEKTEAKRKLFKIASFLEGGNVALRGLPSTVQLSDLLPVRINSAEDKDISYNPYIAAGTVNSNGDIPTYYNDDRYYLDALKEIESDSPTIYEQIVELKLAYVHEVQHLLREGTVDDGLKIKE